VPEVTTDAVAAERSKAIREVPLFFSFGGRPLYGVFHAPNIEPMRDCVLVFCHSIGTEHMMTQRIEALGARSAAAAGFGAFHYHSRGYGDSGGHPQDVTFEELTNDASTAADIARELSGASRIIWVGIRFGCFMAAEAIARRNDAAALALWDPVLRGSEFFRGMIRAKLIVQLAKGKRPVVTYDAMLEQLEREGELPLVGTYLYRAFYRSAVNLDLARSLQKWRGDTLIAQVRRRHTLTEDNEHLRTRIQLQGGKVGVSLINEEPTWNMMPLTRPQWSSDSLLSLTMEWLHGLE
jgi:pimeloyl-ACP methyl ester carboxylesterase